MFLKTLLMYANYAVWGVKPCNVSLPSAQICLYFVTAQYREWTVGPLNWNLCDRACRITHLISIMAASQLHVLANENGELAGRSQ